MLAAHVARDHSDPESTVAAMESDERLLTVDWGDGHRSAFHTIWLRDNCSCDDCGDHGGGHRFFELGALPGSFAHEACLAGGLIRIVWTADGHVTTFDPAWLRAHCYADSERAKRFHKPVTWDAALTGKLPRADYAKARGDGRELLRLYDSVRTYGICLLEKVPARSEATEELASLISFLRETHYGRVFDIVSTPNPVVLANAPVPIRPHTDEIYREPPPGIMIFHCLRASEDGGGASVMTDGFKLAEDFKALHAEDYKLLSEVPIAHRRFIDGVGLRADSPVIRHDHSGNVVEFRLNERTMGPIDLPFDLMEPVYDALRKMLALAYDAKYHVHQLLEGGQALVFDNARVLHARTAFNGNRHVRSAHVGRDEFYSRWRQLRDRFNGDINLI